MKLFDWHCDTVTSCFDTQSLLTSNSFHFDTDRASKYFDRWFQVFAIYTSDDRSPECSWDYAQRVLAYFQNQVSSAADLTHIRSVHDFATAKHGCLSAVENGSILNNNPTRIYKLAQQNIAYVTLTWNGSNCLGSGCFSEDKRGLTVFGKKTVRDMCQLGILTDVSHLNEAGFWDVVNCVEDHPILASHSLSYSVCPHPRNLNDSQFEAVIKSNGLVGLNLCEAHLGKQSFDRFERHWYHFLTLGGETNVALGFDLDGTTLPNSWNGVEAACFLYEHLLAKGYSQTSIEKLFFENSHAFFMKTLTSRDKCIKIGT